MPYTVKSGDTLGQIAAQLGVANWQDLFVNDAQAGDTDPTKLGIGSIIYTPDEGAGGTGGPANADGSDSPAGQDSVTQVVTTGDVAGSGKKIDVPTEESGVKAAEEAGQVGVGGAGQDPDTALTILTGEEMIWSFDEGSGKWYVSYRLPNSDMRALFEVDPDQMDSLFGLGQRPVAYQAMPTGLEGLLTGRQNNIFSGNIAEMEGEGQFEDHVEKVTALALDDGTFPSWMLGDRAAYDILYVAQFEGKSFDWMLDQFATLDTFKARFPNITTLKDSANLTLEEAVTGFLEFEASTRKAMKAAGFSEAGVTPDVIGNLIAGGYNIEVVTDTVATFKRMQDFAPAFEAFNAVLVANGMQPLTSQQELFDFLKGNAPADVYDLYEASSIQEAAVTHGLGDLFSAQDAINVALGTNQNLATATEGMKQAAQLLLRLRNEVDVGKFELDHEELIDISLGMAPRSGRHESEINESISRAVLTAQASLQRKAKPFTGFSETGTPKAASLSNLRQSG